MPDAHDHSLLPIGTAESPTSSLSPALQACAVSLYRQAWRDYRAVGCPYGRTDEAMLVWYSLHGGEDAPSLVTGKN
jgi:hypothetical protein